MKHKRDISAWTLEPNSRLTVSQLIGGTLYDFIDSYPPFQLSSKKSKSLLTCIREETRMSDRTLKRIFCGQSDSLCNHLRILIAIQQWVKESEYHKLRRLLGSTITDYGIAEGSTFLEQQVIVHRTKNL